MQMEAAPYLNEQDTEESIPRIEQGMQNRIPLSVLGVVDQALQLRSKRFRPGITFLRKAKFYQQINSLTCKGIAESCRSCLNWFACQHRLKLKYARSIAGNRPTAATKLKIEQLFKAFEDLIRSFLPKLIFGTDKTMADLNKACKSVVGEGMQR
jgi:hypothetical protein